MLQQTGFSHRCTLLHFVPFPQTRLVLQSEPLDAVFHPVVINFDVATFCLYSRILFRRTATSRAIVGVPYEIAPTPSGLWEYGNRILIFAARASTLQSPNSNACESICGAIASTLFITKKPILGLNPKRYRSALFANLDIGGYSGVAVSYGIVQISRFHQLSTSTGIRFGETPSLFFQVDIFFFPFRRVGIPGVTVRLYRRLTQHI